MPRQPHPKSGRQIAVAERKAASKTVLATLREACALGAWRLDIAPGAEMRMGTTGDIHIDIRRAVELVGAFARLHVRLVARMTGGAP